MRLFETTEQGSIEIAIDEDIQARQDELAEINRQWFRERGMRAFDIAGSVGAGKTSLIAALVERLSATHAVGVIAGDVATTYDAERVTGKGARQVLQINTGGMCHLDARVVHQALQKLQSGLDVLFIENVGNLICPAHFALGVEARIVVTSASEGSHVIEKHPAMFKSADLVVLNKTDIAQAVNVDLSRPIADLAAMRPGLAVVKTNLLAGEGVDQVLAALRLG
ncbi:MAG: hydrogenase nickel incorporation protein HypB [Armatimonadota bacterium]|jgi:hydrogenase nickel incorporation protein HypB